MSIAIKCNCGRTVYAEEGQRGQNLQCPLCGGVVPVPSGMARSQPSGMARSQPAGPTPPLQISLMAFASGCGLLAFAWLFGGVLPEWLVQYLRAFGGLALAGSLVALVQYAKESQ